jgi:hypothetical protein
MAEMTVARFSLGRVVQRLIAMLSDGASRVTRSAYSHHPVTLVNEKPAQLSAPVRRTGANEWTSYVP